MADRFVLFGHHKCGSRFFRLTIAKPIFEANGYAYMGYSVKEPPFHFRGIDELDLRNISFDEVAKTERLLLNLSNSSAHVVGAVNAAAPDARGIHVIRDPRQVLVSNYFHHREGHATHFAGWVWDKLIEDRPHLLELPLEGGLIYELNNITADVIDNQIAPWRPRESVLELKLEDFANVTSTDHPAMRRLLDFIGLPVTPALNLSNKFTNDASSDWRRSFTPRVSAAFKDRYGQLLIDLGYESSLDW